MVNFLNLVSTRDRGRDTWRYLKNGDAALTSLSSLVSFEEEF